jgi:hypothetical protein
MRKKVPLEHRMKVMNDAATDLCRKLDERGELIEMVAELREAFHCYEIRDEDLMQRADALLAKVKSN